MKKQLLTTTLLLASIIGLNQDFIWAKQFDGDEAKGVLALAIDSDANVFTTGEYRGVVDFDPGLGTMDTFYIENEAVWSAFVSKLDTDGEFQWAAEMNQYGSDRSQGWGIATDLDGNVITTGRFEGVTDFDPDEEEEFLINSISENIFVWKLGPDGDLVWAKMLGGLFGDDLSRAVATDADQNILTTGYFQSTGDFDPGDGVVNFTASDRDVFISKLDADGDYVWAKQIGGAEDQEGYSIETDELGNVYVCGTFNGTVDFDPGPGVFNMTDAGFESTFILKLNSAGDFIWAKQFETADQNIGMSLDVDSENNVIIGGLLFGTADFDPGPAEFELSAVAGFDLYIAKLDVDGDFVYAKAIGGTDSDELRDIFVDNSDAVYYTGHFRNTVDFDPGPETFNLTAAAFDDIVVSKLDSDGNFEWATGFGGASSDRAFGIAVDGAGSVYTGGTFHGIVDFDPSPEIFEMEGVGGSGAWIHKLDGIGSSCVDMLASLEIDTTVCNGGFIVGEFAVFSEDAEVIWDITDVDLFTGNPLIWETDTSGTFTLNITLSTDTCSIDTSLTITVHPEYIIPVDTSTICLGDSVLVFEDYIFEEGMYSQTLTSINGCDSTLQKWVFVNPIYNDTASFIEICEGDSALIFGAFTFTAGFYYDSLTTINGCDSIFIQELVVHPLPEVNFTELEDDLVCVDSETIALSATPSGGDFTGTGVSGDTFSPVLAGEGDHMLYYTFEDVNGCIGTDSTAVAVVDCLGINENSTEIIRVYPNPFSDFTTISFGQLLIANHSLIIHNTLGQEVYRNENVTGTSIEINKEQLGVGVYILSVFNLEFEEVFSTKLIVE